MPAPDDLEEKIRYLEHRLQEATPEERGEISHELGNCYSIRSEGSPAENIDRMINHFEASLLILKSDEMRIPRAITQYNIGFGYSNRINGSREHNVEQAISAYQASLTVLTSELAPVPWCAVKNSLGSAYAARIRGSRPDNIEAAIGHLRQVLEVAEENNIPEHRFLALYNLGHAFFNRTHGERRNNLTITINCLTEALNMLQMQQDPVRWAKINCDLVKVYAMMPEFAERAERVIAHAEAALEVYDSTNDSSTRLMLHRSAAYGFRDRLSGDHSENVGLAMAHLESAEQLTDPKESPIAWAAVQRDMADTLTTGLDNDRADTIERSIFHYYKALEVFTRDEAPAEWAQINMNLGPLFRKRLREEKRTNLEKSISASEAALAVFRQPELNDASYISAILLNLGIVYRERLEGNRENNIAQAIAYLREACGMPDTSISAATRVRVMSALGNALRAQTNMPDDSHLLEAISVFQESLSTVEPDRLPTEWSDLNSNLGSCFEMLRSGDRAANITKALHHYQAALEFITPAVRPMECLKISTRVGELHGSSNRWKHSLAAFQVAMAAGRQLYGSSVVPTGRDYALIEIGALHHHAAFAAARCGNYSEAIVILEQGRALGMTEAFSLDTSDLEGIPEAALNTLRSASQQLRELESADQILDNIMGGELIDYFIQQERIDPEQQEQARRMARVGLRRDIKKARATVRELEDRLASHSGLDLSADGIVDWPIICESLQDGVPLTYLASTSYGTVILIAYRANDGRPQAEAIWADDFDYARFAGLLFAGADWPPRFGFLPAVLERPILLRESLDALLPIVGREISGPLADRLDEIGATQVVLIPCGSLGFIPFHAAIHATEDSQRFFGDGIEILYAPSARVLSAARKILLARPAASFSLLGISDPRPVSHPLPFARWELHQIASYFAEQVTLVGEEARKIAFIEAAATASYIHLACHGNYTFGWPNESQLELADGDSLTVSEVIIDRPFPAARLVVLSACQTAVAGADQTPDEVVGMTTSFLRAGIPGVIGTLWQVDDLASALLMRIFYRLHLLGDPDGGEEPMRPARALYRAQRALAEMDVNEVNSYIDDINRFFAGHPSDGPNPAPAHIPHMPPELGSPFAHPRYWAAFVFVGV